MIKRRRAGFNLIEVAMVLGVVGIVIGGVWVAAAAVNKNRARNAELAALITIIDTISQQYKNLPLTDADLSGAAGWNMGVFKLAQGYRLVGGQTFSALNYRTIVSTKTSGCYGVSPCIWIDMYAVSEDDCMNLVTNVTTRFKDNNQLACSFLSSSGGWQCAKPFNPQPAQCAAGSRIVFQFTQP